MFFKNYNDTNNKYTQKKTLLTINKQKHREIHKNTPKKYHNTKKRLQTTSKNIEEKEKYHKKLTILQIYIMYTKILKHINTQK